MREGLIYLGYMTLAAVKDKSFRARRRLGEVKNNDLTWIMRRGTRVLGVWGLPVLE